MSKDHGEDAAVPGLRALPITCPHCRSSFEQPLAWLKDNRRFRCPRCDRAITVDAKTIAQADRPARR